MPAASTPPRVSVILPAWNREALVGRAIESVLAQTMGDLELIVVDDASTDGTAAAVEAHAARDPRVRLVRSPGNLGGGGARNLGVAHARSGLIAFQDSDDRWLPEKLERQLAALAAEPGAALCYCGSLYWGEARTYYIPEPGFGRFSGDMSVELLRGNSTSTQTVLMHRALFDAAGGFDPAFRRYQDWDLMIRLAQATRFAFVAEPLVLIYQTPGNLSSSLRNDAVWRARILEKYHDLFARHPALLADQHYIVGRIRTKLGEAGPALRHLRASLAARPRPKTLAALGLAALAGLRRTLGGARGPVSGA